MHILQINKFYHIVGGVEQYFFNLSKLLQSKGHKIAYFSVLDRLNKKTAWSKFFRSNISLDRIDLKNLPKIMGGIFYSIETRNKISILSDNFQPDLVHIHNIYHHISPSILLEIKRRNIPIVMTVHDYHLISPNYHMFHNNNICEITKTNNFYKAIFHKCVKDSYLASLIEAIEKYISYILGWEKNYIDYFIVPSKFLRKKLIEYGFPSSKIIHLSHFIDFREYKLQFESGNYILYFGRLSPEKGINYLIGAMKLLPKVKLIIAGKGDEEYESERENVKFVGFKEGSALKKLIANSRFTVLPSLWYEVAPISILESFASGQPVIASNIGGIPEVIKNGQTGYLFEPGNMADLVDKINKLWNNPMLCQKLGKHAREYVKKHFGQEEHYEKLMRIYKKVISKN